MKTWAVANQKGGVGKTTTTVTLGGWLALDGQRVLLVDFDPHGSLTHYFGFDPEQPPSSGYALFEAASEQRPFDLAKRVQPTQEDKLFVLPATTALATLDRQVGSQPGMGLILKRALQEVGEQFDYVLIDCPPVLGILLVNALAAADRLLIPVQTEVMALNGLERMLSTLEKVAALRKDELDYLILPTMFDRRTKVAHRTLLTLRKSWRDRVWLGFIPEDTLFRDSALARRPLPMLHPQARGAQAYRQFMYFLTGQRPAGET